MSAADDAWQEWLDSDAQRAVPVLTGLTVKDGFTEGYRRAQQDAIETVKRQTDLTELVHFDKPSDYRKGVLTCLMALTAAVAPRETKD